LHQLALPIQAPTPPTLDNFVCGRNLEALAALRALASHSDGQTFIYLWGSTGSGKTHLLKGLSTALDTHCATPHVFLDAQVDRSSPLDGAHKLLIDNIQAASPSLGESIFHAWNRIREHSGFMVCSGDSPPAQLPLAPELSSRLAWGQVYRLHHLNDEEKWHALRLKATADAIPISDDALSYLLLHTDRDLPSLMHTLERLDDLSLSSQRSISVPIVRAYLATIPT